MSSRHALSDDEESGGDAKWKSDREAADKKSEANSNDSRPRNESLMAFSQLRDICDEACDSFTEKKSQLREKREGNERGDRFHDLLGQYRLKVVHNRVFCGTSPLGLDRATTER